MLPEYNMLLQYQIDVYLKYQDSRLKMILGQTLLAYGYGVPALLLWRKRRDTTPAKHRVVACYRAPVFKTLSIFTDRPQLTL